MKCFSSSPRLVIVDEKKLLTLKLEPDTYAEFGAAAKVFRARSMSSFVHQYVVTQINAAKKEVSKEDFARLVEQQKLETAARSREKKLTSPLNSERLVNDINKHGMGTGLKPKAKQPILQPKIRNTTKDKTRRTG